ncbi:MAG: hypothetical protein KJZ54_02235 [Phycisphaerales bacterium]|nr:hypothetical protein [Phycisphaerales bacterium]
MSGSLLIRDVPQEIRGWIDAEREARMMSQREFVTSVLSKVNRSESSSLRSIGHKGVQWFA